MATPILDDAEVGTRKLLLGELQAALNDSGIHCALAGRQRLVLKYTEEPPHAPSGPTDPALHVFGSDPTVITTDGVVYRLRDGREFPVADRPAVTSALRGTACLP